MKRLITIAAACVLCISVFLCACAPSAEQQAEQEQQAAQQKAADEKQAKKEALELLSDDEILAAAKQIRDKREKPDYSTGVHHAELLLREYRTPIEIEINAKSAPKSSQRFCELVDSGYYKNKRLFWILEDMYVKLGSAEQDNEQLITGEYKESGFKNSNSLKKGVIALSRAKDGQQSDAGSFIIFLTDVSYLDGKYAAFGHITSGIEVIEQLAELAEVEEKAEGEGNDEQDKNVIPINEDGKILDQSKAPVVRSITMID